MTRRSRSNEPVGYGRPPKHTQFVLGQSGNPRGRPKGRRDPVTILNKVLAERVPVTEGGRRRRVSKIEIAFKQLANKAAGGDPRAIHILMRALQVSETAPDGQAGNEPTLTADDNQVIAAIKQRILLGRKENSDD